MMTQTDPFDPMSSGHGHDDPRDRQHDPRDRQQDPQDRATEVAHDAADEARSVANTAQHEAGRVADEMRDQAANLTASAKEQLHEQARAQTDHLGQAIGGVGDRIQALADGRPEDSGNVQQLAQSIADQVSDVSGRIDQMGFDGAIDELQRYARRRPGAFLAGAAVLGFAAARLTQGAVSDGDDGQASRSGRSTHDTAGQQRSRGHDDAATPPPLAVEEGRPPLRGDEPIVLPEPADERMRR